MLKLNSNLIISLMDNNLSKEKTSHNIIYSKHLNLEKNQTLKFYRFYNFTTKETINFLTYDGVLHLAVSMNNSNSVFAGNFLIESKATYNIRPEQANSYKI